VLRFTKLGEEARPAPVVITDHFSPCIIVLLIPSCPKSYYQISHHLRSERASCVLQFIPDPLPISLSALTYTFNLSRKFYSTVSCFRSNSDLIKRRVLAGKAAASARPVLLESGPASMKRIESEGPCSWRREARTVPLIPAPMMMKSKVSMEWKSHLLREVIGLGFLKLEGSLVH
jgi:hypothetical protein